ncbi:MAG: hypothetical protein IT350_15270 [Deltaproteobacteria bacterium]|nr:hypothetical protein [Deltaproteobacteria bacterium]
MPFRPCYVIWMSPPGSAKEAEGTLSGASEISWAPAPDAVAGRLGAEGWDLPTEFRCSAPDSIGDAAALGSDLREALSALKTDAPNRPSPGLSILFVWDGIGGDLARFGELIDGTRTILNAFDEVVAASYAAYPVLANRHADLLIRLPLQSSALGDRDRQTRWLSLLDERLARSSGGLALRRVWIQGPSNSTPQRPGGCVVKDPAQADAWTAEFLATWSSTELGLGLDDRQAAGEPRPVGSVGFARRNWEPEAARRFLARRKAADLLNAYVGPATEKPPPEESEAFLASGVRPSTIRNGILVGDVFDLFVHPTQVERAVADPAFDDLRTVLSADFRVEGIHTETDRPNLAWPIPDLVMKEGQERLTHSIYLAAVSVANLRGVLEPRVRRALGDQVERYLADGRDTRILQTRSRLAAWRHRLAREDDAVDSCVDQAFASATMRTGEFGAAISELFRDADDPGNWVPESAPDPETYADRLRHLLAHRPTNPAVWLRAILAGAAVGAVAAVALQHGLDAMSRPRSPVAGLILAYLLMALSLLWTRHAQRRRKAARERALDTLYIALAKYGRALLAKFLKSQMHAFYSGVISHVGSDVPGEESASDARNLQRGLRHLADRIAAEAAPLAATGYRGELPESVWNRPLLDDAAMRNLPWQDRPDVFHPERPLNEIVAGLLQRRIVADPWRNWLDDKPASEGEVGGGAAQWLDTMGYAYLSRICLDDLAERFFDTGAIAEIAGEMRSAAAPYFHLPEIAGASSDVSFWSVVAPDGSGPRCAEFRAAAGTEWPRPWMGGKGFMAFAYDGPLATTDLPTLSIAWSEPPEVPVVASAQGPEF